MEPVRLKNRYEFDIIKHKDVLIEFEPGGKVGDAEWKLQYMHNSSVLMARHYEKNPIDFKFTSFVDTHKYISNNITNIKLIEYVSTTPPQNNYPEGHLINSFSLNESIMCGFYSKKPWPQSWIPVYKIAKDNNVYSSLWLEYQENKITTYIRILDKDILRCDSDNVEKN